MQHRFLLTALTAAATLAVTVPASAQSAGTAGRAAAQTRSAPAAAAPAPGAGPRPAPFVNIQQLCQLRERELVNINGQVLARNQAAQAERDPARRQQILTPVQNLIANMRETEASWNRMDCARVLYGAR